MGLKKCPVCELNYINEGKEICDICQKMRSGGSDSDDFAVCAECGERPAISDKGLCALCLRTKSGYAGAGADAERAALPGGIEDDFSGLEDMELPADDADAIPDTEYEEITRSLGYEYDAEQDNASEDEAEEAQGDYEAANAGEGDALSLNSPQKRDTDTTGANIKR